MEQINVRAAECRKVEEGTPGPVVVGDRVRYGDRLWRVVGIYLVYDPATGQSEEYCVLSGLNNGTQGPGREG
jgi:hypothetical protein